VHPAAAADDPLAPGTVAAGPLLAWPAVQVCTIIAKNYLAHARVLARSLERTHPGSRLWTLIVDEFDGYFDPEQEPFHTLTPADIGCEPFIEMALRYSVLELSTAVKPWLLRHLMARTQGPVTYLDPDIEIYGSLERLDELADRHGVVLIPHNTEPIPADGRKPSQVDVMIAGIYNLGYVSLAPRQEVEQLLRWWADRLERDCRVDPIWGYFVDQRWFDLAPGFLPDLSIVRDPEYNVAYWNLHERALEGGSGGYRVNDRPLAFFHFSGFDPSHPTVLSRHQDRIHVTAEPVVKALLAGYAAEILAAGHDESRTWPYGYAALGDGTRLDNTLRSLYDDFMDSRSDEPPSPFTLAGARVFEAWLTEQSPGAPTGINRLLGRIYERRSDLRSAYTTATGIDGAGLRRWASDYGALEEPHLAHLLPANRGVVRNNTVDGGRGPVGEGVESVPASPAAAIRAGLAGGRDDTPPTQPPDTAGPLHREPFGVNVVGYFRSELGTGEAARQMVTALDTEGVPVLPIHGHTIPLSRQHHPYETAAPEDAPFPVNLICMNADMLPEFARQVGTEFFAGRFSIGLWFWEVNRFPERWRESFSLVEEVWAPTAHIAAALTPLANVPVHTVRLPVTPSAFEMRSRADLGLPEDKCVFLFSFDYLSVAERKNPLATIAAFRRAFAPGDGAELIVKCINQDRDPAYHAMLTAVAGEHPDITIVDRYLSPAENRSLPAMCDCYVSLHRAEGFGLVLADAMWQGKPVIATGYSGNLDFMTESNSLLVDHELVTIGEGFDPYPADGVWAEPSIEHAAALMRRVFDDRAFAQQLGDRAARDIRSTHSAAVAGKMLGERLEAIRATGRVRPRGWLAYTRSPALSTLPRKIRQGPSGQGARRRAARDLVRRAVLRTMRPFTVYQQDVNRQMADAMQELGQNIGNARRDAAGDLARVLAELRGAEELRGLRSLVSEQARRIEELERRLTAGDHADGSEPGSRSSH
jgi:glycosyltransferase involved in cell wall biosynthesis